MIILWLTDLFPMINHNRRKKKKKNRPSGDLTKSVLIHLPAAGEGVSLLRKGDSD